MRRGVAPAISSAAGLLLAACGADKDRNDNGQKRVAAMGEAERNTMLTRVIHRANRPCGRVTQSRVVGPAGPVPTYAVNCDTPADRNFIIFVRANGAFEVQDGGAGAVS